jgi:hypothetical protein
MSRALFLLLLLGACAAPTYTIDGTAVADAQGRAERYCRSQNATAQFTGTEQQDGANISVYRCVPATPAQKTL